MSDIFSAIVGASAVVVVGYATNFLKEDYVRFLDSRALASALAGELESHSSALPILEKGMETMISMARAEQQIPFRPFSSPTSPVFEQSVSKLGLLGSPLAGEVAYLYENIRAFRLNFAVVMEHGNEMSSAELVGRLKHLLHTITNNRPRAEQTIVNLNAFANAQFRPWFAKRWRIGQQARAA